MSKAGSSRSFLSATPPFLIALFLGCWACAAAQAEGDLTDAPPQQTQLRLTLEECLRRALEENLSLSAQALNIRVAQQGVVSAQAAFDPQLGLDLLYEKARSQQDETDTDRRRADLSWSKKVRTGQVFRVTHAASRFNRGVDVPVSPFYDLDWTFSAAQPLARGAGLAANMAPVWVAQNEEQKTILTTTESIMELLSAVEGAYLDLNYAIRFLDVQHSSLRLAQELLAKNEELARVGKLPARSIEVQQATATIAAREEGIIIALNGIAKAEDTIRRLLNMPARFEEDRPRLIPADEPLVDLKVPKVDESLAYALAHRPQVQALKLDMDSAALELAAARNNRLPNVDLRADLGFAGSDSDYGSSFDDLAEGRDYVWQVGLSVSYPWGNRAARSRYVQATLNYERTKILFNDSLEQLRLDVINAHRDIDTDVKRMASTKAAVEQAELQLQLEDELYAQGMSNSFRILEFQDDLIAARIRHLGAAIDFNRSYYNLLRVEGRAIRNDRFDLTDIVEKIIRQLRPFRRRLITADDLPG